MTETIKFWVKKGVLLDEKFSLRQAASWKEIFDLLSVLPRGTFIESIQLHQLGLELTVECLYDPDAPKPFTLTFSKCKSIRWEVIDEDDPDNANGSADVIGLTLGEESYQEAAVIHTDIFEIIVLYDTKTIVKNW
ncbi:MAG: hypothetical protein ACYDEO_16915 [Aggregatilineales bacterium]